MKLRISDYFLFTLAAIYGLLDQTVGAGSRAYHSRQLLFFAPPDYSVTNFDQLLWRLKKRSIIKKTKSSKTPSWKITLKANDIQAKKFPLLSKQKQPWDKQWRIVYFDIPETKSGLRKQLRSYLIQIGFGQIQKSVYLSPHNLFSQLKKFIIQHKLNEWVNLYEGKRLWMGSNNSLNMVKEIWNLNSLSNSYTQWIRQYKKYTFPLKPAKKKILIHKYISLLLKDPLLPRELLPKNWPGFQAQTLAKTLI